ncbi:MAG: hypothetical protein WCW40_07865 [Bacteroidota bacterium]
MIILNLMITMHEALFKASDRTALSELIAAPAQSIEYDLKLAGPDTTLQVKYKKFLTLGQTDMKFYAVDTAGTLYIVRYYLSGTTLYRSVNNVLPGIQVAQNVYSFRVRYFRLDGTSTTSTFDQIHSVYVKLTIQSAYREAVNRGGYSDTTARKITWEQHFFPDNL